MDISTIINVVTMQRRRCHAGIPMNVFGNINLLMAQRHRCHAGIPMNVFGNINLLMAQRHRFYAGIPMNVFGNCNARMVQLGTSCVFDSPGLARNEPTSGKRSQGDSTP
ncbi:tetrahydrofolate synthase [Prevotella salivae]|uniref:Tetrahydrofolate synthase n=2 Tax=Segatella salivae TaxID=228604 RepID=A0AAW4NJF1_9BACT|nr:hypothetical protein [Segatella salivae]EFV04043.1 hypothetical protein HMPREF9420_1812 [Segatella salivae DSM 15606]MBW4865178.1 tetrahydrofolate synthase [Segatella salivae]MBW4909073.1 tetrahydrofolate synthase [Segatella salivae]